MSDRSLDTIDESLRGYRTELQELQRRTAGKFPDMTLSDVHEAALKGRKLSKEVARLEREREKLMEGKQARGR